MINCIAIDDEPLALNLMEDYIKKTPYLTLKATCKSAFQAIEIIRKQKIDLAFVDVHMPDLNGIDFLKSLQYKPMIIFTTAYESYAVEGFNLDAIDYLIKPITFDRFLKAANKANEYYEFKNKPSENIPPTSLEKNFLFVRADYQTLKINFENIFYIEGYKDYIKIYTDQPNPILTLQSLKSIEALLPQNGFARVHRSFIISIAKIEAIQRNKIKIKDKYIPIGDLYKEHFNKLLDQ